MGSISSLIMLLLVTVFLLISSFAEGRSYTERPSKHIIKTIKVPDGDVVDCIDIYKQPSFSHPLLWNHTLQIEPSEQLSKGTSKKGINSLNQPWKKYGSCPQGSIPILRQKINTNRHFKKRFASSDQQVGNGGYHSHAVVHFKAAGSIHGGYGTLNTWNPTTGNPEEFSLSQIWVVAGKEEFQSTMEAGWHVYPNFTGDSQTRLFIYWTKDGYQSTGCYNLQCEGFVQTNKEIAVGGPVEVSTYGGKQSELEIGIEKDKASGNWWLDVHGTKVGYWPATLFKRLAMAADYLGWGGEVYITLDARGEKHTPPQMGSGHLPKEGYKKASYIRDIKYIDTSGSEIHPKADKFETISTAPTWCYNVELDSTTDDMFLYFGGPGCQSQMKPMI